MITDIGMPEMDGYELARQLQEERPDLPIVYMTGYGDVDVAGPFLRKPFAPDALVRKVGEVLAFGARASGAARSRRESDESAPRAQRSNRASPRRPR